MHAADAFTFGLRSAASVGHAHALAEEATTPSDAFPPAPDPLKSSDPDSTPVQNGLRGTTALGQVPQAGDDAQRGSEQAIHGHEARPSLSQPCEHALSKRVVAVALELEALQHASSEHLVKQSVSWHPWHQHPQCLDLSLRHVCAAVSNARRDRVDVMQSLSLSGWMQLLTQSPGQDGCQPAHVCDRPAPASYDHSPCSRLFKLI